MQLLLCSNAYDEDTYFEICGFHKNTKILTTRDRNIIFSSNKKNSLITHQGLLYDKQ